MPRVPIIRVGDILIATLQEGLSDDDAVDFRASLNERIEKTEAAGVLLDLSQLDMIDSFLGRVLNDIAIGSRLLGSRTVVAGVQPAVAITLVELGLELKGVQTALTTDKGLALLGHRNGLRPADER